jgi:hypothetical protein
VISKLVDSRFIYKNLTSSSCPSLYVFLSSGSRSLIQYKIKCFTIRTASNYESDSEYEDSSLLLFILCGMAKAIIMCMHIQQEMGGNGCTTKTCIINRKQHVKARKERTANSYRWWCFGCCHRQSCDIARSQGNCVALRLPLHNCGGIVPTFSIHKMQHEPFIRYSDFSLCNEIHKER